MVCHGANLRLGQLSGDCGALCHGRLEGHCIIIQKGIRHSNTS